MSLEILDNPFFHSILFHPRRAVAGGNRRSGMHDGSLPVGDGERLGYRLFEADPADPLVILFHGNGEIAADYDDIAPFFRAVGASLLVVDFRGYGWSSGQPSAVSLIEDMAPLHDALPGLRAEHRLTGASVLMGRSLGSICAIEMAHRFPESFAGLIIESGLATLVPLLARLGAAGSRLAGMVDPVGNVRKMGDIELPLLVIHGERDQILPVENGQALHDASPARDKRLLRVAGAGHNDLLFVARDRYFDAIGTFLRDVSP